MLYQSVVMFQPSLKKNSSFRALYRCNFFELSHTCEVKILDCIEQSLFKLYSGIPYMNR